MNRGACDSFRSSNGNEAHRLEKAVKKWARVAAETAPTRMVGKWQWRGFLRSVGSGAVEQLYRSANKPNPKVSLGAQNGIWRRILAQDARYEPLQSIGSFSHIGGRRGDEDAC